MMHTRNWQTFLALGGCLTLGGCTPQSSQTSAAPVPSKPAAVELTGQVTAPQGLFGTQAEERTTGLLDGPLISAANAFDGAVSLGGMTIGLWSSDPFGVAVGEPIAVTQTDNSGYYVLPVPEPYVPTPALVIGAGNEGYYLRRMVTGTAGQDISLATEIALQSVLAQTGAYPVDVRVIPAPQFETVYTMVDQDFSGYDLRPIMLKIKGPKKVVYQNLCVVVVNQVRARPAMWTAVGKTVRGSYESAKKQGHGVLVVHRAGNGHLGGVGNRPWGYSDGDGYKSHEVKASGDDSKSQGKKSGGEAKSQGNKSGGEAKSQGKKSDGGEAKSQGKKSGGEAKSQGHKSGGEAKSQGKKSDGGEAKSQGKKSGGEAKSQGRKSGGEGKSQGKKSGGEAKSQGNKSGGGEAKSQGDKSGGGKKN